jgi:hypothetical protein
VLEGHRLIDNIFALARFIGVELRYSDIDHCNQLSGSHKSNAAPVFVKFVSRWMRDEFYSCYLHCVKGKALTVSMLFRLCKNDNRRIYLSEHLTLHDSAIFREGKRLKRMTRFREFSPERALCRWFCSMVMSGNQGCRQTDETHNCCRKLCASSSGRVVAFECWCLIIFLAKFLFSISYFD